MAQQRPRVAAVPMVPAAVPVVRPKGPRFLAVGVPPGPAGPRVMPWVPCSDVRYFFGGDDKPPVGWYPEFAGAFHTIRAHAYAMRELIRLEEEFVRHCRRLTIW